MTEIFALAELVAVFGYRLLQVCIAGAVLVAVLTLIRVGDSNLFVASLKALDLLPERYQ